jgi:nitrile hydratase accessory protein
MTQAPSIPSDILAAESLLREVESPGFAEPWQAQAFACAIQLSRRGLFTWNEWVEVFSAEIKAHPARPGETSDAAYYRQWLAALETIVGLKGAASPVEIDERQETWRRAYLNTPHGQPVELSNARDAPVGAATHDHDHDHGHHQHGIRRPVAVSPAKA